MNLGDSVVRRLATAFMQHAADVIPESRADWAHAMRNELEHIEGDFAALRWAMGCVMASYVEKGGAKMDLQISSFRMMVKKPSAFVPMAMSLTALGLVAAAYALGQTRQPQPDEGTLAHLWQLLMAGQLPVLAFFLIKWLPRAPRHALYVLGLQITAVLAAMAPVYLLHL